MEHVGGEKLIGLKCQVIKDNGEVCNELAVALADKDDVETAICFKHFKSLIGESLEDVKGLTKH